LWWRQGWIVTLCPHAVTVTAPAGGRVSVGVGGGSGGGACGVGDSAGGAAGNSTAPWRSRWWSVELHAQAAARTLRAVVAPEAPMRAALLRRGAAGRCGSQGEAARPWRRLRPRERGGGGAEARAGGRAAAAQLSRRPGRCTRALQCSGPVGAGRGIGVPTAANSGASPQPTSLPLPSHHRLPSPPHLSTLPWDQPPPAAGVQDCLLLPQRLISAQCCGRWRTRCARWPLELQLGRRY
jgi:hypothetical protein